MRLDSKIAETSARKVFQDVSRRRISSAHFHDGSDVCSLILMSRSTVMLLLIKEVRERLSLLILHANKASGERDSHPLHRTANAEQTAFYLSANTYLVTLCFASIRKIEGTAFFSKLKMVTTYFPSVFSSALCVCISSSSFCRLVSGHLTAVIRQTGRSPPSRPSLL